MFFENGIAQDKKKSRANNTTETTYVARYLFKKDIFLMNNTFDGYKFIQY